MGILVLVMALFSVENEKFINTMNQQMENGYKWEYVGKQPIEKNIPSISIKAPNGEEYVFFKLKK
tara:strand:- start:5577 stop:5771 length:195 start_codon:yes stop_codon:yes gene_type:complete